MGTGCPVLKVTYKEVQVVFLQLITEFLAKTTPHPAMYPQFNIGSPQSSAALVISNPVLQRLSSDNDNWIFGGDMRRSPLTGADLRLLVIGTNKLCNRRFSVIVTPSGTEPPPITGDCLNGS